MNKDCQSNQIEMFVVSLLHFVSLNTHLTTIHFGVMSGNLSVICDCSPFRTTCVHPRFLVWVRVTRSLDRCLSFCTFFFWPLCCPFFFDIWILITPLNLQTLLSLNTNIFFLLYLYVIH